MMKQTVVGLNARIHKLTEKDALGNARLIAKLKRQVRRIEARG